MSKPSKRNANYNQEILEELKNKYDVSPRYIIMSIAGDRNGTLSIRIKNDYLKMNEASIKAIHAKAKQLN